jgi:short-subunit dehydrogenase
LLNTNVIGAHRLNRAALPAMPKQGAGLLLYVGSGVSRIIVPFVTPYIVGKSALDVLAESTSFEVGRYAVETTIVMPGLFTDGDRVSTVIKGGRGGGA